MIDDLEPEYGADLEPERPPLAKARFREDLRTTIAGVMRSLLRQPDVKADLVGPPGPPGPQGAPGPQGPPGQSIRGGGGGGVTVSGAPISALAAGSNVTITTSGSTATIAGPANELTADQLAAVTGADSPSGANPFTTGLRWITASVSSAEILTMEVTPIVLVAAVAGKMYVPIAGFVISGTGDGYTTAGNFQVGVLDGVLPMLEAAAGPGLNGSAAYTSLLPIAATEATAENTGLIFMLSSGATGGTSTIEVSVLYATVDIP